MCCLFQLKWEITLMSWQIKDTWAHWSCCRIRQQSSSTRSWSITGNTCIYRILSYHSVVTRTLSISNFLVIFGQNCTFSLSFRRTWELQIQSLGRSWWSGTRHVQCMHGRKKKTVFVDLILNGTWTTERFLKITVRLSRRYFSLRKYSCV